MKFSALILVATASLSLSGCEYILSNLPGIYHIDVDQGNMLDQSMVDQLRPSMTKRQVQYIMGSPMLGDTYHNNRWNYLYSSQEGGNERLQKRITLIFKDDILVGMQGDFRPSSKPVEKVATTTTVDLPKRDLESSMWEKITGIFSDSEPNPEPSNSAKPQETSSNIEEDSAAPANSNILNQ